MANVHLSPLLFGHVWALTRLTTSYYLLDCMAMFDLVCWNMLEQWHCFWPTPVFQCYVLERPQLWLIKLYQILIFPQPFEKQNFCAGQPPHLLFVIWSKIKNIRSLKFHLSSMFNQFSQIFRRCSHNMFIDVHHFSNQFQRLFTMFPYISHIFTIIPTPSEVFRSVSPCFPAISKDFPQCFPYVFPIFPMFPSHFPFWRLHQPRSK